MLSLTPLTFIEWTKIVIWNIIFLCPAGHTGLVGLLNDVWIKIFGWTVPLRKPPSFSVWGMFDLHYQVWHPDWHCLSVKGTKCLGRSKMFCVKSLHSYALSLHYVESALTCLYSCPPPSLLRALHSCSAQMFIGVGDISFVPTLYILFS